MAKDEATDPQVGTYNATYNPKDADGSPTGDPQTLSAEYNFGADLAESVELFGEAVVQSAFVRQSVISLQSVMRSAVKRGADLPEAVAAWVPGIARVSGKSPVDKAMTQFDKMSDEQKQAFIANLQAKAKQG